MDIPASIYIGIGAVIAAIVAGFFSFLNLVSSKENKVSEFRQNWINGIREEISEYSASMREVVRLRAHNDKGKVENYLEQSSPLYFKAVNTYNKIRLRLNPVHAANEPDSHEAKLLSAIKSTHASFNAKEYKEAMEKANDIPDIAAPFLKDEWERVKEGEKRYQNIRRFATYSIVIGMLLVLFLLAALIYLSIES
ncbi:hypothetical protein J3369_18260 [Alteromonas sp. NFXS44]|uniref:hypothetical protein n=1 Tax=Alteromonas sp. NFXS44 TaxID=2818435 RepID=UPI0032E00530